MIVYLVQHAEAKTEAEDPARPLSERGLRDITGTASHISRMGVKVDKIFHSPKLRAKQTAEVLSENLRPAKGLSEIDGLSPLDTPDIWAARLKEIPGNVMLVGHLPHLARLASLLLCGDAEKHPVSFHMGAIVCLKGDETGTWSLGWMLTPEMVVPGERWVGPCDGL